MVLLCLLFGDLRTVSIFGTPSTHGIGSLTFYFFSERGFLTLVVQLGLCLASIECSEDCELFHRLLGSCCIFNLIFRRVMTFIVSFSVTLPLFSLIAGFTDIGQLGNRYATTISGWI